MNRRAGFAVLAALTAWAAPGAAQCPDGSPPPCGPVRPRPAAPPLIAVLLFENLTRDTTEAYLASGLTEELIRLLDRTPGLRVASRSSTQRFGTGAGRDPAEIARALSATFLVRGSIQKDGDWIRVTAELARAPSLTRVWGDRFDRGADRLLALQDDLAAAVAREVSGSVGVRPPPSPAIPPAAFEHFQRGNYLLNDRRTLEAIRQYARAIELAPGFGRAYARHAYAHANLLDTGWPRRRDSVLAAGVASVERALELAREEADAWMADAYLRMFRYPNTFEGVAESFARAIVLDSGNAEAHHQYAWALLVLRRDSLAAFEYRRALSLDPDRWTSLRELGLLHDARGRVREAIVWYDSAAALGPTPADLPLRKARALLALRDTAAAVRALEGIDASAASVLRPPDWEVAALLAACRGDTAAVLALVAPRAAAAMVAEEAIRVAAMLAWAGREEEALHLLEGSPPGLRGRFALESPYYERLRRNPRFAQVVATPRTEP